MSGFFNPDLPHCLCVCGKLVQYDLLIDPATGAPARVSQKRYAEGSLWYHRVPVLPGHRSGSDFCVLGRELLGGPDYLKKYKK